MPVFFWTSSTLRKPLEWGIRIFRNNTNDSEEAEQLTAAERHTPHYVSPWPPCAELRAALRSCAPAPSATSNEQPSLVLSEAAIEAVVVRLPSDGWVPLAFVAAHPRLREACERRPGGVLLPHVRLTTGTHAGDALELQTCCIPHLAAYTAPSAGGAWWLRRRSCSDERRFRCSLAVVINPADPRARVRMDGESVEAARAVAAVVAAARVVMRRAVALSLTSMVDTLLWGVEELCLQRCEVLSSEGLAALPLLPRLRTLDLSHSTVDRVDDLAACARLQVLRVRGCASLQSLSALGGCPALREVIASQSGVHDVSGLARSRTLTSVSVFGCHDLIDVGVLGAMPALAELMASESAVDTIDGLGRSGTLRLLSLRYCDIASLSALAPLATLATLNVSCTPIDSVAPLVGCRALQDLDVGGCARLRSLSPLGALPLLARVCAEKSGVSDVSGLAASDSLHTLALSYCDALRDVGMLGECVRLERLLLGSSGVRSVAGLLRPGGSNLQVLDISFCKRLELPPGFWDESPPSLRRVHVDGCPAVTRTARERLRESGVYIGT